MITRRKFYSKGEEQSLGLNTNYNNFIIFLRIIESKSMKHLIYSYIFMHLVHCSIFINIFKEKVQYIYIYTPRLLM